MRGGLCLIKNDAHIVTMMVIRKVKTLSIIMDHNNFLEGIRTSSAGVDACHGMSELDRVDRLKADARSSGVTQTHRPIRHDSFIYQIWGTDWTARGHREYLLIGRWAWLVSVTLY
jgi:hypothetical protein